MKKFVKIAAIVVAVILAVALIVPFALRGKIADIVKREANEMLAAKLDFEKLDISLLRHFPNASLDLKGLTLVGVDRFEGDTIVAAQRISVVVNLMSLFGDSGFEVTKVILSSPAVHAHKLADGAVNWDVMKPSDEAAEETPAEESSEPSSFRMSVRDFRISDAAIRYEDDSTNMRFSTAPLSLRLRGNMSADRTDLDLRLTAQEMRFVSGGIPLLSGAEAELVAVIDADLANNRFTFSRNTLRLNAISVGLDGWVELDDDAVVMDLTAGCDKVQFKDVLSLIPAFYTREFKNLTAGGELSMALWAKGEMRGSALPAFELKTEVRDGSFQYSSLPKAVTGINIAAKVANPGGVMDKTVVDLSKFGLKMAGNSVSATFYATNLVSDPVFRATAAGRVDLGAVKEVYPLEKGVELGGKTLGVIGYGRIGQALGRMAQGLGMNVVAYDIYHVEGIECETMHYVTMDELLAQSDFISLHTPAIDGKPLINRENIAKMKDGVIFVNTSRGNNVDEEALLEGLNSGKIRGAGLDVYAEEPAKNEALLNHPNVSCTPHIGAATKEAQKRIGMEIVSIIDNL